MNNLDNNRSFDKMVEKAREDGKGDQKLLEILLTERIANQFLSSMITKNPPPPPPPHVSITTKIAKNEDFKVESSRQYYSKKKVQKTCNNNDKKPRKRVIVPENPQLPEEFKARIEAMNGTEIKLVIHKPVFATDLNIHHERFSIPRTQIISKDFLRPKEKEFLHNKNGTMDDVKLIGPKPYYKIFELKLRKWDSNTSWSYALTTKWPDFIRFYTEKKKMVKENDVVQIWSFRINSILHFAFVKVEDDDGNEGGGGGGGDEEGESGGSTHERRENGESTYERGESSGTKYIAPVMEE